MKTYEAFYNKKKIEFEAKSLYAAKVKAIELLKVPKSKTGLLAIQLKNSQDFRFN